jgi:hypothetical protein
MKTGIDSYCYHRFFGEVYPQQRAPSKSMTLEDFLLRAHELGVDGVSLESCFLPRLDLGYLAAIRGLLDSYKLELTLVRFPSGGFEYIKREVGRAAFARPTELVLSRGPGATLRLPTAQLSPDWSGGSSSSIGFSRLARQACVDAPRSLWALALWDAAGKP